MTETAQMLHHDVETFLTELQSYPSRWSQTPDWRWRILVLRILAWMLRHVAVSR